ncbi:hypothetical protein HY491_02205 [Candidatus Woesearchaeota archaeon]|nr:hypothetical protein [Candidatus Woesearchaeota archaeon]
MSYANPESGKLLLALFVIALSVDSVIAAQITGFFVVDESEANRSAQQTAQQTAQNTANETAEDTTAAAAITGSAIAQTGSSFLQPVVSFFKRIFLFWRD